MKATKGLSHSVVDGQKRCPRCKAWKPVSEFYTKKNGHPESRCRPCKSASHHEQPVSPTLPERFFAKLDKLENDVGVGCWGWNGAINNTGYGVIFTGGRPYLDIAARVSLRLHGIEVPSRWTTGLVVDHMCYNPICSNPQHLRIIPQRDNANKYARRERAAERSRATKTAKRPLLTPSLFRSD